MLGASAVAAAWAKYSELPVAQHLVAAAQAATDLPSPALRGQYYANVAALPHNLYGRSESISWIN